MDRVLSSLSWPSSPEILLFSLLGSDAVGITLYDGTREVKSSYAIHVVCLRVSPGISRVHAQPRKECSREVFLRSPTPVQRHHLGELWPVKDVSLWYHVNFTATVLHSVSIPDLVGFTSNDIL